MSYQAKEPRIESIAEALFVVIGILGAASASRMETNPKKVLFEILYSDGTLRREKVNYGSVRYRTLMLCVEE